MDPSTFQSVRHRVKGTEHSVIQPAWRKNERNSHSPCCLQSRRPNAPAIPSKHLVRYLMGSEVKHAGNLALSNQFLHSHPPTTIGMKADHLISLCMKEGLCRTAHWRIDTIGSHGDHRFFFPEYAVPSRTMAQMACDAWSRISRINSLNPRRSATE